MNHLHVVLGHRAVDLDQVETRIESAGRNPVRHTGEVAIGNEGVIRLYHQGSEPPRFPEELLDRGGAGIDGQLRPERERVGIEVGP
jgi:hypothetical protein